MLHGPYQDPRVVSVSADTTVTESGWYIVDTSSSAITLTIDTDLITSDSCMVVVVDGANNANAKNITVATEGSEKIDTSASDSTISSDDGQLRLVGDGSNLFTW